MKFANLFKSSAMAAIALAMIVPPIAAQAQDGQWRNRGDRAEQHQQRAQRAADAPRLTPQQDERRRLIERAQRNDNRGDRRAVRVDRQSERNDRQVERRVDRRAEHVQGRDWNNRGDRNNERARDWNNRGDRSNDRGRDWNNRDRNDRHGRDWNNRSGHDWNGHRSRGDWREDRRDHRSDRRDWREDRRDYRQDRRWDRRWRDNSRYDWHRYRSAHRDHFSVGRYYSPYRNYHYRRPSIGFRLDSLFLGSRYWIHDPYQYRLPEVYGPYRWVRYYDDVLLVDIYSGEVVDVVHNFFW